MKLNEIMTRQVEVVGPDSSVRDAAGKMYGRIVDRFGAYYGIRP